MVSKIIVFILSGFMATVLCCGSLSADDRFSDNGDGTLTDHYMQLMWAKSDNQGKINWRQAQKWVQYTFPFMVGNKYNDWRLPTPGELKTLFISDKNDKGRETDCGMRVKIISEINLTCGWVWSSKNKDISATVFSFKDGYYFSDLMRENKAHRALAVRSLK